LKARPYLLLVVLALIWGVHWSVTKIGLQYMPPFTYGAFRIGTALATVVALLAWRRGLRLPDRHDLPILLSVSIGQIAASIVLINLALLTISAGRSSILFYTMPLWVAAMQLPTFRREGAGRLLLGLLVGLVGIALLLNPAAIEWSAPGQLLGGGALLLAAILWAGVTIHIRRHAWRGNPLSLEPWQLLVALVPVAAAALFLEGGRTIRWEPTAVVAVLYSGPLATALAFWLNQSVSRSLPPLGYAMSFLAVPIVGLTASWLLLGEPLSALDMAGVTTTFAGILIVSLAPAAAEVSPSLAAGPPKG
jgi:drug/metabolite transporter (DMT)-like permease